MKLLATDQGWFALRAKRGTNEWEIVAHMFKTRAAARSLARQVPVGYKTKVCRLTVQYYEDIK